MMGNVSQWTQDLADSSALPIFLNFEKDIKNYRVTKGGSWNDVSQAMTPEFKAAQNQNLRWNFIGFRVLRRLKK
jgi:formylglycine-generating enzyme required for sulfatase activity